MMLTSLAIDDFHPAPNAVCAIAKSLKYGEVEHEGFKHQGIGLGYKLEGADKLLASALGASRVEIDMEYFRLGTKEPEIANYIHADSGVSNWAVVLYLSEPPEDIIAGTAFWKHSETNLREIPDSDWMQANGFTPDSLADLIRKDHADEYKWKSDGLIGQKFNRAAVYPSKIFHSRFPKEAWGSSVNDGRLVWTAFFRTS